MHRSGQVESQIGAFMEVDENGPEEDDDPGRDLFELPRRLGKNNTQLSP